MVLTEEIFREIDIKELMNKKNVQDFNKIEKFKNSKIGEIGFGGVLGALKVISLSAHFCNVKIRWQAISTQRPQTWQAYLIWDEVTKQKRKWNEKRFVWQYFNWKFLETWGWLKKPSPYYTQSMKKALFWSVWYSPDWEIDLLIKAWDILNPN